MWRVVHCDGDPRRSFDVERSELAKAGATLVMAGARSEEELIEAARDADGLLVIFRPITSRVIDALTHCRVIARYGVGVDNVDLAAATTRGIVVANVPDYCLQEVSNHAILFVLACAKRLVPLNNAAKSGGWRKASREGMGEIHGQTLGIVGLGHIGRLVAAKARALGMRVLAYDPYMAPAVATVHGAQLVSLPELLANSDYVSLHTPLSAETEALLGAPELRLMKPTAYLINTSRGRVVDEAALIEALREGRLTGAALDVLAKEPPDADNPLLAMDNVIVTPHTAAQSDSAMAELARRVAESVADVLSGHWPRAVANPSVREFVSLAERDAGS